VDGNITIEEWIQFFANMWQMGGDSCVDHDNAAAAAAIAAPLLPSFERLLPFSGQFSGPLRM